MGEAAVAMRCAICLGPIKEGESIVVTSGMIHHPFCNVRDWKPKSEREKPKRPRKRRDAR